MSALAPKEGRWYYFRDRKKVGPLTWEQLRHLATTGQVTLLDLLLRDGESKWQPAKDFPDLFVPQIEGTRRGLEEEEVPPLPSAPSTRDTSRNDLGEIV